MSRPQPPAMCPDWVITIASNCHVAKNHAWFSEYTPFSSVVTSLYRDDIKMVVAGIGTVELSTKRCPNRSGRNAHGILRLTDVLHVPSALCNLIGSPLWRRDGYNMDLGTEGRIKGPGGRNVAYVDGRGQLHQLKLSGQPVGPSVLKKSGTAYCVSVTWPASEQRRWMEHKERLVVAPAWTRERYTPEEKTFLKKTYRNEYHLLRLFGLSIYKEEDREEGRAILRAMMTSKPSDEEHETVVHESSNVDASEEDDNSGYEVDEGLDLADYNFSDAELDFMVKYYGCSARFMALYGLKFYDKDDYKEARVIVQRLMAE